MSISICIVMPFNLPEVLAYRRQLEYFIQQIQDILDDLFLAQLELEDGEMPILSPTPAFDPMKTIGKYE